MEEIKELEIGEFVRTKNGIIDKIENYSLGCCVWHCVKGMCIDRCNTIGTHLTDIVKHSKNIIDLVEVGDIVHIKDVLHEDITHIWSEDYFKALKEDIQNGIKLVSILTKEQMASIEYKVEEDK